ncbi:MAG: hypothetical protein ABI416_07835 [Ginsengibacter sp.]
MKNKILWCIVVFFFSAVASKGQQEYKVGTSTVSIEPDSTLFSIALSGYGYPAEGRFSINFSFYGNTPGNITAITGLNGKFFAADSNHTFWSGTPSVNGISWKKAGSAGGIKALAGINESIYAVNDKGELLMTKITPGGANWVKIGAAAYINTLTSLNGKLYATNNKNQLMKMDPLQTGSRWISIGRANVVQSMASHGERFFAINAGDTLWHIQPHKADVPWTEIGRYNDITFNIHIKQIAVVNNRLYAVSKDNKLYIGAHTSDGNLSATAFAIQRNKKTVVFVGVDLTGFSLSLSDDVKDIVSKERHIAKEAILINASHTHFSPSAQAYLAWQDFMQHPDSLYLNNILKKKLVKAIENAIDHLSPADLYFGRGTTNIGMNRSGADPENPLDKTLDVLVAKNGKGTVTGVLFLAACHAVFNSEGRETYTISANFPGTAREVIRGKTGTDAVFIQGCAGDINPRSLDHTATGRELANDVFNIMDKKITRLTGEISYSFDTVNVPVQHIIPAALDSNGRLVDSLHIKPWSAEAIRQFQMDNANKPGNLFALRNTNWGGLMLNMIQKRTVPDKLAEYIQIISIGNWKMVGLSREAVNEYGPAIRNIWPGNTVSVAGYCNDVGSYLPNKWHVAEHHYEGYDSFFWYGQPGVPALDVFDIVIEGIKSFKR